LTYLAESPWSAMIRAFIVYLCLIAGLYFAIDDPFKNSTPAQYTRLAGTVSVLALLVGYDPTRLRSWIGLIPNPQSQKVTVTENPEGQLKVEAKQGPLATFANGNEPGHTEGESQTLVGSQDGHSTVYERTSPAKPESSAGKFKRSSPSKPR